MVNVGEVRAGEAGVAAEVPERYVPKAGCLAHVGDCGTWQARMRFTNVKVPRANRLHHEGRGLNVALTCLNIGRCTLSAGMMGAGKASMEQAIAVNDRHIRARVSAFKILWTAVPLGTVLLVAAILAGLD